MLLRSQALNKLRSTAQAQQQMLTSLRRSAPCTLNQPLSRFFRMRRVSALCSAVCQWRLVAGALNEWAAGAASSAISSSKTRLKRAGAQESALLELRAECEALRAHATERERQLALVQKQLATAVSRRRVVESDGKQAQELLSRVQAEQGRALAMREGLLAAQEGEAEWRFEAARAVRERHVLVRELEYEEQMAQYARELVLSCHGALLEAQQVQKRHTAELHAERRRGLVRVSELQVDLRKWPTRCVELTLLHATQAVMAADMNALEANLRKQKANKAMRAQAKKRGG